MNFIIRNHVVVESVKNVFRITKNVMEPRIVKISQTKIHQFVEVGHADFLRFDKL